jgi:hypothetical protein
MQAGLSIDICLLYGEYGIPISAGLNTGEMRTTLAEAAVI